MGEDLQLGHTWGPELGLPQFAPNTPPWVTTAELQSQGVARGLGEGRRDAQVEPRGFLGQRNCFVRCCKDGYVALCMFQPP